MQINARETLHATKLNRSPSVNRINTKTHLRNHFRRNFHRQKENIIRLAADENRCIPVGCLKVAEKRVRRSDYRKALKMAFSARKIDLLHTFSVDGEAFYFFPLAIFSWFYVVVECDILKKFRLKRVHRLLTPYKTVQVLWLGLF